MHRGRQQQPGAEDPQQRAFDGESAPDRVAHDREHKGGRNGPGTDGIAGERRDHREGALVGGPVAGVGAQALGERAGADGVERAESADRADGREGQIEGDADGGEGDQRGRALAPDQYGEGGGRSELDQGGGGEEGAGQPPSASARAGRQDQGRHQEEPGRVEVGAPCRLHDQEGRPEVPDKDRRRRAPRARRDPLQQEAAAKVKAEPEELGGENGRSARQRRRAEEKLGQRRVDGRDVRVVDLAVPGRVQGDERAVAGRVRVGVDALREEVAVPQVAVDVVGQFGREGKQNDAGRDGDGPDERDRGSRAPGGEARGAVGEEGRRGKKEPGKGKADLVQPPEGAEGGNQDEPEEGERQRAIHAICCSIYS